MFDWLFPAWSSPARVAAFFLVRTLVDVTLVALLARTAGPRSRRMIAGGALTVLAAVLMLSVLRPGGPGRTAGNLDLVLQVVLLAVAGHAVWQDPSRRRWVTYALLLAGSVALLLPTVVLYGEATVAP